MRRIGAVLMVLGVIVGVVAAGGTVMRLFFPHIRWWAAIGLTKLAFISALAIIGVGAGLVRIARRRDEREAATQVR